MIAGDDNVIATPFFDQIERATRPSDLFPNPEAARSTYRRLAKITHPDVNPDDATRAEQAFARLTELWNQFSGSSSSSSDVLWETKRHTFVHEKLVGRGDIANVYRVSYESKLAALKLPRTPKNNDLIVNEITQLKQLKESVPDEYEMYHPRVVDSFRHKDASTGKERRALVTEYLDGFVTLQDVRNAYPFGISPRDVAWIARRLWIAVDTAHEAGVMHGAVFPDNVMIHPTDHNVVLIDWTCARARGDKLDVVLPEYKKNGWYGSHWDKPLDHRLDVHQASRTLESLLGTKEARPFRAFFNGCRVASTPTAGQLFAEFDELLKQLYGKRSYHPFEMPNNWKKVP